MSIERLKKLEVENAIKGFEMQNEAGRFTRLASRHEDGTAPRAVSAFNLFQTPEHIAKMMVEMLPHQPEGAKILEPSAGLGRIFNPLRAAHPRARITLVEQSSQCTAILYKISKGCTLKQNDFLSLGSDAIMSTAVREMRGDFSEFILCAPDSHGLYSRVAGLLTAQNLNILGAHKTNTSKL